jgi:hypothetical protein
MTKITDVSAKSADSFKRKRSNNMKKEAESVSETQAMFVGYQQVY